jgi:hypothetical protein
LATARPRPRADGGDGGLLRGVDPDAVGPLPELGDRPGHLVPERERKLIRQLAGRTLVIASLVRCPRPVSGEAERR